MTQDEFARGFFIESQSMIDTYFDFQSKTEVTEMILSLNLDNEGNAKLRKILAGVLRDSLYTILLGLDGEANIGNRQIIYRLSDEDGNELTGGDISASAYEYFHNDKFHSNNE